MPRSDGKNLLRRDPTRTGMVFKRFKRQLAARFNQLRAEVLHAVVEQDALGLRGVGHDPFVTNTEELEVFNATSMPKEAWIEDPKMDLTFEQWTGRDGGDLTLNPWEMEEDEPRSHNAKEVEHDAEDEDVEHIQNDDDPHDAGVSDPGPPPIEGATLHRDPSGDYWLDGKTGQQYPVMNEHLCWGHPCGEGGDREFKSVGTVKLAHGDVHVHYDPEVTSEDTAKKALAWLRAVPASELKKSSAKRIEIYQNPEDVHARMTEVGVDPEVSEHGEVRGAFHAGNKTLYSSIWSNHHKQDHPRTLYHELGHSIVGQGEEGAESWAQSHIHHAVHNALVLPTSTQSVRIAVVGGGPGGLFYAWRLLQHLDGKIPHEDRGNSGEGVGGVSESAGRIPTDSLVSITIYEASDRLGGKVRSGSFPQSPGTVTEYGVAELYAAPPGIDDPLRRLIEDELGLTTFTIQGEGLVLDGRLLNGEEDFENVYGPEAAVCLDRFKEACRAALTPEQYHSPTFLVPKDHPRIDQTYQQMLDETCPPDTQGGQDAQKFIKAYTHSDVAVDPNRTTAMYGIYNWLTNDPDYLRLYSIRGGIESLTKRLEEELRRDPRVTFETGCRVVRVTLPSAATREGEHLLQTLAQPVSNVTTLPCTIAVDLDGTLAQPRVGDRISPPREGALDAMKALKARGCRIIVHTARGCCHANADLLVRAWLTRHGFPYDDVVVDKPVASVYVDDLAVDARVPWPELLGKVEERLTANSVPITNEHMCWGHPCGGYVGVPGKPELKMTMSSLPGARNEGARIVAIYKKGANGYAADEHATTDHAVAPEGHSRSDMIGFATVRPNKDGTHYVAQVHVDEPHRRQGLASAMYDHLRSQGITLGHSPSQTDLGEKFRSAYAKKHGISNVFTGNSEGRKNTYTVEYHSSAGDHSATFDRVVCCLPAGWVRSVDWSGLDEKLDRYLAPYDNLGNYLRVTLLFSSPFWRGKVPPNEDGSRAAWWMVDDFGGACCYDESMRDPGAVDGVLSWLIAGDAAQTMVNLPEDVLTRRCIASLPQDWQQSATLLHQRTRVDRYIGEVSGLPGDAEPIGSPDLWLDPQLPGLMFVGDYQKEGTLVGLLESASEAAKATAEQLEESPTTNIHMCWGHACKTLTDTSQRMGVHDAAKAAATDVKEVAGHVVSGVVTAEHAVKALVQKNFEKLPAPAQAAVKGIITTAFAGWTANQALAERVAKERGATPEQAAKLRSVLAAVDIAAFKPASILTASLGPAATAASWVIPPATGAYLLYSTARSPLSVARAAVGMVKDALTAAGEHVASRVGPRVKVRPATNDATANVDADGAKLVADALAAHDYDDRYHALLAAAMDGSESVEEAVKLADSLYEKTPTENAAPPVKYATATLDITGPLKGHILALGKQIADADLDHTGDRHGREERPHITLESKLLDHETPLVKKAAKDYGSVKAILGKTVVIPGKDRDVVAIEVRGTRLRALRQKISDELYEGGQGPPFHPHITLAYVKKGAGDKYAGQPVVEGVEHHIEGVSFQHKVVENGVRKTVRESYFSICPRDAAGHCASKGGGGKPVKNSEGEEITDNSFLSAIGSAGHRVSTFLAWLRAKVSSIFFGHSAQQEITALVQGGVAKGVQHAVEGATAGATAQIPPDDAVAQAEHLGRRAQSVQQISRSQAVQQKVTQLAARLEEEMRNVTTEMATKMGRLIHDAFSRGDTPETLADALAAQVDLSQTRAILVARTELTRAHADSTLESLGQLGVTHVGVVPEVEFTTAGDEKVCRQCSRKEGKVYTLKEAAGVVPQHPNCRCRWTVVSKPIVNAASIFPRDGAGEKGVTESLAHPRSSSLDLAVKILNSRNGKV